MFSTTSPINFRRGITYRRKVINIFPQLKLTRTKNFYQLFFLLNKNQITEILKTIIRFIMPNLVERRWLGKGSQKSVIASYVCRKNMFYNQISLKGFSKFSIKSLAFSIASVIPALPKPFIAIPCHL